MSQTEGWMLQRSKSKNLIFSKGCATHAVNQKLFLGKMKHWLPSRRFKRVKGGNSVPQEARRVRPETQAIQCDAILRL